METAKTLEVVDHKSIVAQQQSQYEMLMTMASSPDCDIAKLEKMMDLQERHEKNKARQAFVADMARFKSEPIHISKDKKNSQYKSRYASIGNMINTVTPELSKYGFSANFKIDQSDQIQVTCIITHKLGHSESVSMSAKPDGSGSKNPIQQMKSTITYLRGATFEAALGIASSDANLDDDGNGFQPVKLIDEKQVANIQALMDEVKADEKKFLKYFKVNSISDIPASHYKTAINSLEAKRKK